MRAPLLRNASYETLAIRATHAVDTFEKPF